MEVYKIETGKAYLVGQIDGFGNCAVDLSDGRILTQSFVEEGDSGWYVVRNTTADEKAELAENIAKLSMHIHRQKRAIENARKAGVLKYLPETCCPEYWSDLTVEQVRKDYFSNCE